jgi:hypothetical protein
MNDGKDVTEEERGRGLFKCSISKFLQKDRKNTSA